MEVILGAVLALGIILLNNLVLRKPLEQAVKTKLQYTQSRVEMLMSPFKPYMSSVEGFEKPQRQSTDVIKKSYVRVVIAENSAYWIKDNALYVAEVIDGFVDKESTRRVDTINMDSVELEKTMAIVEKLREGLDEDSGTGH